MKRILIFLGVVLLATSLYGLFLAVRTNKSAPSLPKPVRVADPTVFVLPSEPYAWRMHTVSNGRLVPDLVTDDEMRSAFNAVRPLVEDIMETLETSDLHMNVQQLRDEALSIGGPETSSYLPQPGHLSTCAQAISFYAYEALEQEDNERYERAVLALVELLREMGEQEALLVGLRASAFLPRFDPSDKSSLLPDSARLPGAMRHRIADALRQLPPDDPFSFGASQIRDARMNTRILRLAVERVDDPGKFIYDSLLATAVPNDWPEQEILSWLGEFRQVCFTTIDDVGPSFQDSPLSSMNNADLIAVIDESDQLINEIEEKWDTDGIRTYLHSVLLAADKERSGTKRLILGNFGPMVVQKEMLRQRLVEIIAQLEE
jgi:hypothetical protein